MTSAYTPGVLAQAIEPFVDSNSIAGNLLVVADAATILAVETVGFANIASKTLYDLDTLAWIASNTKSFGATAVMMLVDDGKISLDDPVSKYIPIFAQQMVAIERDEDHMRLVRPDRPVTVRNLLSMTSGFDSWYIDGTLDSDTLQARAFVNALRPLNYQPGTEYMYGNGGFETAARIVEIVSGLPFDKFVQARLTGPLELNDTTFYPNQQQLSRLAQGYRPHPDHSGFDLAELPSLVGLPNPAGGLFSTARDMVRFAQMIMAGGALGGKGLLSEAAVREMTSTQIVRFPPSERGYGLGFDTTSKNTGSGPTGKGVFGHGGAWGTRILIDADSQLIKVMVTQTANELPEANLGMVTGAFIDAADKAFTGSCPQPESGRRSS